MNDCQTKMVIVARKDLNCRKGKYMSQSGHASLGFLWKKLKDGKICFELSEIELNWYQTGQTKITVQVKSEEELLKIYNDAKDAGLEVNLVTDLGRTEFNGIPTNTCLAIGPDCAEKIDEITGHLELF